MNLRICPICGTEFKNEDWFTCTKSYILHHLKKHNLKMNEIQISEDDMKEYRRFNNIKVKERNRKNLKGDVLAKNKQLFDELGDEKYNKLAECKICGLRSNNLYKHITIHDMTVAQYKEQYNSNLSSEDFLKMISEANSGENNPMFGIHDPKNSPYSVEFYLARGYSLEQAEEMRQAKLRESVENKKN